MKFNESAIPANYSEIVKREKYAIPSQFAEVIFTIGFKAAANFLSIVKTKTKTALKIDDVDGNFILAFVTNYHANDDTSMPGNYSLEVTFDIDDIESAKVFEMSDATFKKVLKSEALSEARMNFKSSEDLIKTFKYAFKSLLDWLKINEGEIEHGAFVAVSGSEDDEKVYSVVPDGVIKRLIKDDGTMSSDVIK